MTPVAFRNEAVQRLRRLARQREARQEAGLFVLEGAKVIGEAHRAGARIQTAFIDSQSARPEDLNLAETLAGSGTEIIEVQAGVLARVIDTVTPQPVAATAARVDVPLGDVVRPQLALILAGVSDPGNAGALIRTAAAAGADLALVSRHSVDVYNPKTVRATAGAIFHLPLVIEVDLKEALDQLGRAGVKRWGTQTRGGCDFTDADLAGPSAIVLGNEAHGIPELPAGGLDGQLTIPMSGAVESLNVAVAGSLLLFEAARQRNLAGKRGKRRGAA